MGKAGHLISGAVDLLTLCAVGAITASVGAIVLFNIASTAPANPMWQEVRCWTGLSLQGDEGCFKKRLKDGLVKMESVYEEQKARPGTRVPAEGTGTGCNDPEAL